MYLLARLFMSLGVFFMMYFAMLSKLATVQSPSKTPAKTMMDKSTGMKIQTLVEEEEETKKKKKKHKKQKKKTNNNDSDDDNNNNLRNNNKNNNKKDKKFPKPKKDPRCQVSYSMKRPTFSADLNMAGEGFGPADKARLGPCVYVYPERYPPRDGWLEQVDWFHQRTEDSGLQSNVMPTMDAREDCYLQCLAGLEELHDGYLLAASLMGLERVTKYLVHEGLNPTYVPPPYAKRYRLNAYQSAIIGGHAKVLDILVKGDLDTTIDDWGRSARDYISLRGSPIRPYQAAELWNVTIDISPSITGTIETTTEEEGWDTSSEHPHVDNTCELDVVDDLTKAEFFRDYYVTGRPLVLRNHASQEEISSFSRETWESTKHFHPTHRKHDVGPTAYPGLTGQDYCDTQMSVMDILRNKPCPEMPNLKMIHAEHDDYFDQAYRKYEGDPYKAGFRKLPTWFGYATEPAWQIFMGGDGSGATLHWHAAALNILYIGTKQWHITPPHHRGFTGMTVQDVTTVIQDEPFVVKCTQRPGDLFYIPDFWGHMTVNHGFGIGVAAIVSTSHRLYMGSIVMD